MRVLVTGGAGFIGSHVVDQLVFDGHEVVVIDTADPAALSDRYGLPDEVTYHRRDLQDPDACLEAVGGVDAVCHLAARVATDSGFSEVRSIIGQNDVATGTLLWALHRNRFNGRLVLGSSMEIYGEGAYLCPVHDEVRPGPRRPADLEAGRFEPRCQRCDSTLTPMPIAEDARPEPRTIYASTKLHQEHLCRCYAQEHPGTVMTSLRYHNVYGPRMHAEVTYEGVASIFRRQIDQGERPQVYEDGGQRRDFVHVDDVTRATVLALTADRGHDGALNVATGRSSTLLELATALCVARNSRLWPQIVGRYRAYDVRHVLGDPQRAADTLGFRTEISLADGISEFVRAQV